MVRDNLSAIIAVDLNGGLGYNNRLPWHIKEDLKNFKRLTLHKTVVMGSKTALSIYERYKTLLPERKNLIISREPNQYSFLQPYGSFISVEQVLLLNEDTFIIGGADIYSIFIPLCAKLYLTLIHKRYKTDRSIDIAALIEDFNRQDRSSFFDTQEQCLVHFEIWTHKSLKSQNINEASY